MNLDTLVRWFFNSLAIYGGLIVLWVIFILFMVYSTPS